MLNTSPITNRRPRPRPGRPVRKCGGIFIALAVATIAAPAFAIAPPPTEPAPSEVVPDELEGVGVTEHLGAQVPTDLTFINEAGQSVKLADLLKPDQPVILNLGYYGCPMLCGLVMNGMLDAMKGVSLDPGDQYQVLSVSIDPSETPQLAAAKKRHYLADFARPGADDGWHFLTGSKAQIRQLTDAVGYGYKWNAERGEYAHAAVLIVLTPDGRVSRYLYGITFPPKTVRLSLVEASAGKIGSALDRVLLYCFHYDPAAGSYTLTAMNIMRAAAAVTVTLLGAILATALYRERRKHRPVHRPAHAPPAA